MKWSEEKVLYVKKQKEAGYSDEHIAAILGRTATSVQGLVKREGWGKSRAAVEKIRLKNFRATVELKRRKRYRDFARRFGRRREAGWLVGLLSLAGKYMEAKRIRLATRDNGLAKEFKNIIRAVSKSRIEIRRGKLFMVAGYTIMRVADLTLTQFIKNSGESFCRRWIGIKIKERELEFYRGILQGVFDRWATLERGSRRVDAVRLYTEKLQPGAVRNIRWALKRFGLQYTMQGGLTENERKFYKSISNKMRRLERAGFPERKGKILLKRNFMYEDYDKRKMRFYSVPAIKIKSGADNLRRFAKKINFRRSDLKARLRGLLI